MDNFFVNDNPSYQSSVEEALSLLLHQLNIVDICCVSIASLLHNLRDGFNRNIGKMFRARAQPLTMHRSNSDLPKRLRIVKLDRHSYLVQCFYSIVGGFSVACSYNSWMEPLVQKTLRFLQQLPGQNDRRRRPISHFIILRLSNLDQHLRCRVLYINLVQYGRTVTCDSDISQAIDKHFVHTPWAKCRPDNFRYNSCRANIGPLRVLTSASTGSLSQYENLLTC